MSESVGLPARGWHRPVGRWALLLVALLVLLGWLALMAAGLWWGREHWMAQAALRQLPLALSLPSGIQGQVDVQSRLQVQLDTTPTLSLPIDQNVSVRVLGDLQARTTVRADVPVSTTVTFEAAIPVETMFQAEVPVISWLPSMTVQVPVRMTVPVRVAVPVQAVLPLVMDLAVTAQVPGPMTVPIKTRIRAQVPLKADLSVQITRQADFTLEQSLTEIPMVIEQTLVRLPFKDVSWHHRQP